MLNIILYDSERSTSDAFTVHTADCNVVLFSTFGALGSFITRLDRGWWGTLTLFILEKVFSSFGLVFGCMEAHSCQKDHMKS